MQTRRALRALLFLAAMSLLVVPVLTTVHATADPGDALDELPPASPGEGKQFASGEIATLDLRGENLSFYGHSLTEADSMIVWGVPETDILLLVNPVGQVVGHGVVEYNTQTDNPDHPEFGWPEHQFFFWNVVPDIPGEWSLIDAATGETSATFWVSATDFIHLSGSLNGGHGASDTYCGDGWESYYQTYFHDVSTPWVGVTDSGAIYKMKMAHRNLLYCNGELKADVNEAWQYAADVYGRNELTGDRFGFGFASSDQPYEFDSGASITNCFPYDSWTELCYRIVNPELGALDAGYNWDAWAIQDATRDGESTATSEEVQAAIDILAGWAPWPVPQAVGLISSSSDYEILHDYDNGRKDYIYFKFADWEEHSYGAGFDQQFQTWNSDGTAQGAVQMSAKAETRIYCNGGVGWIQCHTFWHWMDDQTVIDFVNCDLSTAC